MSAFARHVPQELREWVPPNVRTVPTAASQHLKETIASLAALVPMPMSGVFAQNAAKALIHLVQVLVFFLRPGFL